MSKPSYTEAGELVLASFNGLTYDELKVWMADRLMGRDLSYSDAPGDMPHYLVASIYHRLNRTVREDLQNVTVDFLSAIAEGDPDWIGPPGEELLLLTDPILLRTTRREEILNLMLTICRSEIAGEQVECCRFRAAQALVVLDYRASPRFWIDLFATRDIRYIPIIVEALANSDLGAAIKWLNENGWRSQFTEPFIRLLPIIIERYGASLLRHELRQNLAQIPVRVRQDLEEFARAEGLEIFSSSQVLDETELLELASFLIGLVETSLAVGNVNFSPLGGALLTLRRIMPLIRQAGNVGGQVVDTIWKSYVACLQVALGREQLAATAYEYLISELPPAEALDVTRLVLREGYLSKEQCRETLLLFYEPCDVDLIVGKYVPSLAEVPIEGESLQASLVAALRGEQDSMALFLRAQDLVVPRSEIEWARSIQAYLSSTGGEEDADSR